MDEYIEIPSKQLTEETLQAVIEDYVTREGTDYGLNEYTLEQKVSQVQKQLRSGRAVVVYDTQTESCTLLLKE